MGNNICMGITMNAFARALMFTAVLLGGCRATKNVAVSSYHVTRDVAVGSYRVATAPVHYALRRQREDSAASDNTSIATTESDVTQPGQSVPSSELASVPQQQPRYESERVQSAPSSTAPRTTHKETTQSKTKPPSSSRASAPGAEFPTAKAVPDKPGYVFSPFDPSKRYVDVSGYASGSKVKDPWTDKIFIVP